MAWAQWVDDDVFVPKSDASISHTLEKLMAPFFALAKMRVERREDLASMVKNLAGPENTVVVG